MSSASTQRVKFRDETPASIGRTSAAAAPGSLHQNRPAQSRCPVKVGTLLKGALVTVGLVIVLGAHYYAAGPRGSKNGINRVKIYESGETCNGTDDRLAMCLLTNAYYWRGQLYYVAEDPTHTKLFIPRFALPAALRMPKSLIRIVTAAQLKTLLLNSTLETEANAIVEVSQGVLYHRIYVGNYYHTLWEGVANIHMLACKMFGKCTYNPNEQELQLFFFDPFIVQPSWLHPKLYQCVTTLPFEEMAAPRPTPAVRIHQLTLGLGPEGVGQTPVVGKRNQPPPAIMASLVQRVRAYVGVSEVPAAVSEVETCVVLVVQRPRASHGRSISNVEEVQLWLEDLLPGCEVQVEGMEGKTLQQQAQLWGSSTMVVTTHGAQMSSAIFMPNNSFVLEVDQWELRKVPFYKDFVLRPMTPYLQLGHAFISALGPQSVNVSRRVELQQLPTFANFTLEQQQQWLEEPRCRYSWMASRRPCFHWLKYFTDIVITQAQVEAAVATAVEWLEAHGVQVQYVSTGQPA